MRHHRMLILLFAATLLIATALAFTSAAQSRRPVLGIQRGKATTELMAVALNAVSNHKPTIAALKQDR